MINRRRKYDGFYAKIKDSYKYLKTSWSVQAEEFFENSSLHGVKYIVATDRPFIERFMWFICVTTGAVATIVVIFNLWDKFQTNPTITGLDTDFHSWQVPFPAVTLCPEEPASLDKIRTYLGISDVQFNMQYIKETDIKWSLEFSVNSPEVLTSIYIQHFDDIIGIDVQPQVIWDYKLNEISLSIKQTYTTEDTRQLTIKQRRCVFEDEIKLKVDEIYTYTACTMQCRMQNARRRCGCVPFFYPKVPGFKYCNVFSSCIATYLSEIKDISKCDCQLGCTNTVYEIKSQQAYDGDVPSNGQMEIKFISWPMVRYKREVLFGWVDLFVSFGGIAGLFLGFSLLSGVEIIYYFTIRACIAAFREREYLDRISKENKQKSLPPHDLSLVPYFISEPLPGHGINIVVKSIDTQQMHFQNYRKKKGNKKIGIVMVPPFGIEFIN